MEIPASEIESRPIDWLWEPYIPRGIITVIAGIPGQGKSLFTCWLAAKESHNGKVIISNSEDDYAVTVKPRLEAAGANMNNVIFLDPPPVLPDATENLIASIRNNRAKLVIIDPLQDHLVTSIYSPRVTKLLSPLSTRISELNCALVIVSHVIKSIKPGTNPLFAIGGSSGGVSRVARVVHIFGRHPTNHSKRAMAFAKANILAQDKWMTAVFDINERGISFIGRDGTSADDILYQSYIEEPPVRAPQTLEQYRQRVEEIRLELIKGRK